MIPNDEINYFDIILICFMQGGTWSFWQGGGRFNCWHFYVTLPPPPQTSENSFFLCEKFVKMMCVWGKGGITCEGLGERGGGVIMWFFRQLERVFFFFFLKNSIYVSWYFQTYISLMICIFQNVKKDAKKFRILNSWIPGGTRQRMVTFWASNLEGCSALHAVHQGA